MLNQCCIPRVNNTHSACIICFIHCWFLFVLLQKDIALWVFQPCGVTDLFSYQGSAGLFSSSSSFLLLSLLAHHLLVLFFHSSRLRLDLQPLCRLGYPTISDTSASANRTMGVQVFPLVQFFIGKSRRNGPYSVFWRCLRRIDIVSSLNVRICQITPLAWAFLIGRHGVPD